MTSSSAGWTSTSGRNRSAGTSGATCSNSSIPTRTGASTPSRATKAAGTGCSTLALATNGDGIAQDNEIGPGTNNFGARADRSPGPDFKRQYNWEFTSGVQHQVAPRLAVGWMMYKRRVGNISVADKTQISPADYTSFTLPMPDFSNDPTLAGVLNPSEVLTIYNLNSAKRGVFNAPIVDISAPNDRSLYTGFETNFSLRIQVAEAPVLPDLYF